jgi:hypothetical protein
VSVDIRTTFRFEPISGERLMTSDGTLTWKHEQHVIEAAISTRKVVQRRDIIMVGIVISIFYILHLLQNLAIFLWTWGTR